MNRSITISGAGPAGLAAAISLAHAGWRVAVLERHAHVGLRFHGDFQGIENWTGDRDALEELATYGIRSELGQVPFREATYFSPGGREYTFRSEAPWFYLVRRGTDEGTLDFALRSQALAEGVQIQFNTTGRHLPEGGIVAEGPRRADAVAVGHVFETDLADGAFCAVADNLAPKGYAYLLIHRGRGTVATCLFRDFHMEKAYLARTVDFFQAKAGLRMRNPRFFGGSGNLLFPPVGRRARLLYVGEAAGFQDPLFGFGMRYAMLSGVLAARAWESGRPESYDGLWKARLGGYMKSGLVNRYLYERLGQRGYEFLLSRAARHPDVRGWMHGFYGPSPWKTVLYPFVVRGLRRDVSRHGAAVPREVPESCDCTWCRCCREAAEAGT